MAARYHAADARSHDHVWCFGCNPKRPWDAITLFGKFADSTGKFTGLLRIIARDYGIQLPEVPSGVPNANDESAKHELAETLLMLDVCERRLKSARSAFDMRSYLIVGSVLDKLSYSLDLGGQPLPKARETMQQVLDKIRKRSHTYAQTIEAQDERDG